MKVNSQLHALATLLTWKEFLVPLVEARVSLDAAVKKNISIPARNQTPVF
jgi:hypothetical protein